MLLDVAGRPLRRAIGFLAEYRVERDAPVDELELVGESLKCDDDVEDVDESEEIRFGY